MSGSLGEFEQLVMLAVLRLGDDAYGVTIRREIAERTGRDVSAGAVYTTLARMEARGLVSSALAESAPERSGKRRRYYGVEPVGAEALHRSYADLQSMLEGVLPGLTELARASASSGPAGS